MKKKGGGYLWLCGALTALSIIVMSIAGIVRGEEISVAENIQTGLDKLVFNQSILYSLDGRSGEDEAKWWRIDREDKERFRYAVSVTVLSFLDKKLNFDLGFVPQDDEAIGLVSYKLFSVERLTTIPVLKDITISPLAYIGAKRLGQGKGNNEADFGYGVSLISLKW